MQLCKWIGHLFNFYKYLQLCLTKSQRHAMITLEVCAANIESVIAAEEGIADRIELCSALEVGGLTPSAGLIRESVNSTSLPVMVLIRPRAGHFYYSQAELNIVLHDIQQAADLGASGIVIGALDDQFSLDMPSLEKMVNAAEGLDLCFHRAIDFVPDVKKALESLTELGFSRVLSSGQERSATEGAGNLKKMVQWASPSLSIMPGGGIHENNIVQLMEQTGAREFHFSAKEVVNPQTSAPEIPGLDAVYYRSSVNSIRKIREAIGKRG